MATSQEKFIVITSVVVLLIGLTVIGLVLKNTKNTDARVVASCPDYWYNSKYPPCSMSTYGCCSDGVTSMADAEGTNCGVACVDTPYGCCADGYTAKAADGTCPTPAAMCYNTKQLGDYENCKSQDFSTTNFTGSGALCQKQTWAKTCRVAWDGITNVPNACGV